MSRFEKKARSLNQLDGQTLSVGKKRPTKLVFELSQLPSEINKEEIIFDLDAIRRRSRLGGISEVHIVGMKKGGEKPYSHPAAMGEPANEYNQLSPLAMKWVKMTSLIDLDAIQSRIAPDKNPSNAWATEINRALSTDLYERGIDHLMKGILPKIKLIIPTVLAPIITDNVANDNAEFIVPSQIWTHFIWNSYDRISSRKEIKLEPNGFRWSLFSGLQLDRAGALELMKLKEGLFHQQKLVRALPQKS